MNRQQAHDWVELLTYLGHIPSKASDADTPGKAAVAASEAPADTPVKADPAVKADTPVKAAVAGSAAFAALEKLDAAQEEVVYTRHAIFQQP